MSSKVRERGRYRLGILNQYKYLSEESVFYFDGRLNVTNG